MDVLENMGWTIYRIWSTDWIKDPVTEGQYLIDAVDKAIADFGNRQLYTTTKKDHESEDYVSVNQDNRTREQRANPYGFEKYVKTDLSALPKDRYGYVKIEDCIKAVVTNEFPIHYEYLCQRLAYLFGNEKATVKVRREVDQGLSLLKRSVIRKGDFLYPSDNKPIVVRMPNTRKSQHISPDELQGNKEFNSENHVSGLQRFI